MLRLNVKLTRKCWHWCCREGAERNEMRHCNSVGTPKCVFVFFFILFSSFNCIEFIISSARFW